MSNISVIIPHYNDGDNVLRAYNSVLKQTKCPKEIIMIDDASTEKSYLYDIEKKHDNSTGIILKIIFLENNQGPSVARNIGVENSNGEYIAFLDADDVWHHQKLEIVFNVMVQKKLDFIAHKYLFIEPEHIVEYDINSGNLLKINKLALSFKTYLFTPAVIMRKSSFRGFPTQFKYSEDFCCWLISNKDESFYYLDLPLANGFKKPLGESGLSGNIVAMHQGFVKALFFLRKEKYINRTFFCMALIFEYVKYPLRFFR